MMYSQSFMPIITFGGVVAVRLTNAAILPSSDMWQWWSNAGGHPAKIKSSTYSVSGEIREDFKSYLEYQNGTC